ncbi:MAG: hypothetical protein IPH86_15945 [bacterium]|nr:hypothetical protein [bacterium]
MVLPRTPASATWAWSRSTALVCDSYQENTVELAEVYGRIISLAFRHAERPEQASAT